MDINANAKAGVSAETPGIDNREARQNQRIENGVESGQLNEHEANRLERQQDRIENAETKAKADGEVTKKERARIQHKQNKANHNIARKKHNKH
ncbi:hypothetical protein GC177_03880 [bacterium]|nr:hypothetical protein [bacterium]